MSNRMKETLSIALALMSLSTTQVGAVSCNTRTFSGDWKGGSYGIECEIRSVASGNLRGYCYREHYDQGNREFYIEVIQIDGRLNVFSNCFIDGNIRSNRNLTIPIEGRAWTNSGNILDESVLMPSGNQIISFF